MFLSLWRKFPSALCLSGKKTLVTVRISMLLKLCSSPDMPPFSLCNKKRLAVRHMNRPLFPTTLSIPSYDIGKKVGLRTYQHPSYSNISLTNMMLSNRRLYLSTAVFGPYSRLFWKFHLSSEELKWVARGSRIVIFTCLICDVETWSRCYIQQVDLLL